MKQFLYIANWKMNMPVMQACSFYRGAAEDIESIAAQDNVKLIICPSFAAISPLKMVLNENSHVHVGAQDCSAYAKGPFTGEVDAVSLQKIGCTYCIVGHHERKKWHGETEHDSAQKIEQLQVNDITPIICIGETHQEYRNKNTYNVLCTQLATIFSSITVSTPSLVIAYEPIWAIGTGLTPPVDTLSEIFTVLREYTESHIPNSTIHYVYGGSVQANTSALLKAVAGIDGFLIGNASTQWKTLRKIITD